MLQKRCVVRTRSKRADTQVIPIACFSLHPLVAIDQHGSPAALFQTHVDQRVIDLLGNLIQVALEYVAATDVHEAATRAICIQVRHRMFFQVIGIVLRPLGRADQARFFGVPGTVDHCS